MPPRTAPSAQHDTISVDSFSFSLSVCTPVYSTYCGARFNRADEDESERRKVVGDAMKLYQRHQSDVREKPRLAGLSHAPAVGPLSVAGEGRKIAAPAKILFGEQPRRLVLHPSRFFSELSGFFHQGVVGFHAIHGRHRRQRICFVRFASNKKLIPECRSRPPIFSPERRPFSFAKLARRGNRSGLRIARVTENQYERTP